MEIQILKPRQALNKAFLKVKPTRIEIEGFKANFIQLLDRINDAESEEYHKNLISDFLKKTYYDPNFFINTKGRNDLVINNGAKATSSVGVIIEAKKPANKGEMLTHEKINVKAFHELVLYYLRERITHKNLEIKHVIATNINEWFVFDAATFDRLFAQNVNFVKQFNDFESGRLPETKTDFFYKMIAEPFIAEIKQVIEFTHFDIRDYEKTLRNNHQHQLHNGNANDNKLIALFKIFSPEHLLKLPFANDSNSLDKKFYGEMLHIIGLSETKDGSKKLIERNKESERNSGSILENTIIQLDSLDKISRIENPGHFGLNLQEQLFNVGLELCITWINRILFLKLLEAQLVNYHKGDKSYEFLNLKKIKDYDDLNSLFFQILARKPNQRSEDEKAQFANIPYLNSSLFEPTEIEHTTLFISNLPNEKTIPLYSSTVLKDDKGKKRTGKLTTLEYLFEFLNAYDFSSEGREEIQEDNKTLINASVLGLIFEKINGYKDGSFFTPGFITMYICRETIRKAIVQKFNDIKGWDCSDIGGLYNKIDNPNEANIIINGLKICDPAVGSGHFLVSALNEIIAIKNELGVLMDFTGRPLKDYWVEVVNDELFITEKQTGEEFFYLAPTPRKEAKFKGSFGTGLNQLNPKQLPERQIVQQSIFKEKQTIIENCLFGVDINPNSVKICRLRLWIELLKNAFFTPESNFTELETLPNIDINIKCGNSLISRFDLTSNLKQIAKTSKWAIFSYQNAVQAYKNSSDKEVKRELDKLIKEIKSNYVNAILKRKPTLQKYYRLKQEYDYKFPENGLFMHEQEEDYGGNAKKREAEKQRLMNEIMQVEEEIYAEKLFFERNNAFEWRFEFPEVLNDDGDFMGFDVIIGNPPYVYRNSDIDKLKDYFDKKYFNTSGNYDLYKFFIELSVSILKENGLNSLITNSSFLLQTSFAKTRQFLLENTNIDAIVPLGGNVFNEATVDSAIYIARKSKLEKAKTRILIPEDLVNISSAISYSINQDRFRANDFFVFDYLLNDKEFNVVNKLLTNFPRIEEGYDFGVGINTGYIKSDLTSDKKIDDRYHPMIPGTGVTKYGSLKSEGFIMYDKDFIKGKGELGRTLPDEKFFTEPKILIVRTRNISLKERIIATIDNEKNYNLNRISNIISKGENSLEGLLGVLNSKLFNWLYSKRFFDYEIKPIYLRNSPMCDTNNVELVNLVKDVIRLRQTNNKYNISEQLAKIDAVVFQLYNLTNEEIEIIENSIK